MSEDQLLAAPERAGEGVISRVLRAGSARSATLPIALAVAGAAAYAASLAFDWITVTLPVSTSSPSGRATPTQVVDGATGAALRISGSLRDPVVTVAASDNVTNANMLGLLYGLGGLALLTLAAAVACRSDLTARLRPAMSGLGVGVVAVVVASAIRLPGLILGVFSGQISLAPDVSNRVVSYQPGVFCALGAAVLPVLAVWLRARPAGPAPRASGSVAEVAVAGRAAEAPAEPATRRPPRVRPEPWPPNGRAAEPYDLTVTPEN